MFKNKTLFRSIVLALCIGGLVFTNFKCKKIDDAFDYALDFTGVFENADGWQVTLEDETNGSSTARAYFTGYTGSGYHESEAYVGEPFAVVERASDDTWTGLVSDNGGYGYTVNGSIQIDGDLMTVTPDNEPSYTMVRVGTNGNGNGNGNGTPTVLVNQLVSGDEGDRMNLSFTVPSGVNTMVIRTSEDADAYRNTADLFVRRGTPPTVTASPYSWVADCHGINPNREDEVCTIPNPSSGTWNVMLYGYNTYFSSKVTVTVSY